MEQMARRMLDEEMKRREREDIINTVYEEEEKNSVQAKLRNESLEKQRLAKDLLHDMQRQKKAIAERKVQDAAVDNAFAQYIDDQNQIALKQEQEKNQTKRLLGVSLNFIYPVMRRQQKAFPFYVQIRIFRAEISPFHSILNRALTTAWTVLLFSIKILKYNKPVMKQ